MKHFTAAELRNYTKGSASFENIWLISNHLAGCASCRDQLQIFVPDYFNDNSAASVTEFQPLSFNPLTSEHFTQTEIESYLKNNYSYSRQLEMGKHFRFCDACRNRLHKSNPQILEDVWRDLLRQNQSGLAAKTISTTTTAPQCQARKFPLNFQLASVLTVFCIVISTVAAILLLSNPPDAQNDFSQLNTKAKAAEEKVLPSITSAPNSSDRKTLTSAEDKPDKTIRSINLPVKKDEQAASLKLKNTTRTQLQPPPSTRSSIILTAEQEEKTTRGSEEKLGLPLKSNFQPTVQAVGDRIKIKWSKYPQAILYTIFISRADTNELLSEISLEDKTETTIDTKKITPFQKCEIKVAASLPDGTLVTSQTFSFVKRK